MDDINSALVCDGVLQRWWRVILFLLVFFFLPPSFLPPRSLHPSRPLPAVMHRLLNRLKRAVCNPVSQQASASPNTHAHPYRQQSFNPAGHPTPPPPPPPPPPKPGPSDLHFFRGIFHRQRVLSAIFVGSGRGGGVWGVLQAEAAPSAKHGTHYGSEAATGGIAANVLLSK